MSSAALRNARWSDCCHGNQVSLVPGVFHNSLCIVFAAHISDCLGRWSNKIRPADRTASAKSAFSTKTRNRGEWPQRRSVLRQLGCYRQPNSSQVPEPGRWPQPHPLRPRVVHPHRHLNRPLVATPIFLAVRMTRHAISPRLAIRSLRNMISPRSGRVCASLARWQSPRCPHL